MINPTEILNAFVDLLRNIPDLVQEVGGDPDRIIAYADAYPQNVNLLKAIHDMKSPSVLVTYQDWGEGEAGNGRPINHKLTIYVRPASGSSYSNLTALFVNGIPNGQPVSLINTTVHNSLLPMNIEGRCSRQVDAEGVEYWELNISFNETWG